MTTTGSVAFHAERSRSAAPRAVQLWLYSVAALIFAMIIVGGATRLTESGLSITEWQPILGAIPPLNEADWQAAFEKYRQIPQYQIVNKGMSLAEFKAIYWWEWAHRFLGRFIGIAFLVPFLAFWWRGALPKGSLPKLAALFLLGGAQGALGWYMVASGLSVRTDVSQYRLTAHLGLAVLIFGAIMWVALGLREQAPRRAAPVAQRAMAALLVALLFLQVLLGGFVAGTDAGLSHNTWPLMDGALIPEGLGAMQPWYLNLFENVLTVQFNHRMAGYLIAIAAVLNMALAWRTPMAGIAFWVFAAVIAQIALGVLALLSHLQIGLALTHQGGAIVVFALAIYQMHLAAGAGEGARG